MPLVNTFFKKRRQTLRPEKCLLSDIGGTFPIRHWQCKLASTCIMHAQEIERVERPTHVPRIDLRMCRGLSRSPEFG